MSLLEMLRNAPELAASLLDAVDTLVVVMDHGGRPVILNRGTTEATGFRIEDVRDTPFWETFCPSEERVDASVVFSRLRDGAGPVTRESAWQTRDKLRLWVRSTLHPLADEEGMIRMAICTGVDLTQHHAARLRLESRSAELERQYRDQEEKFRAKNRFLAMVNHELRTPLVTGIGYMDLLLGGHLGDISSEIAERMQAARRNLGRLSSLVDDTLAYLRATSNGMGGLLQLEAVDLAALCSECVADFLVRHEGMTDRVHLETPTGPLLVRADPTSLVRVIANLLENAVNHGGDGVTVRVIVDPVPGRRVALSVCDNGVGMDRASADRVFEPFVQTGANRSGSGLGLSIVRGILEAHGTEPLLQTEAGEGTRVSFLLVRVDGAEARARSFTPVAVPIIKMHSRARVLLVEDDADTLDLLRLSLESAGYEVAAASAADDAMELVVHKVPDLALIDLGLPGLDSIRLCRWLKQEALTQAVPVYMFTGQADGPSHMRADAAGVDGYIAKPVDTRALLASVRSALGDLDSI